MKIYQGNCFGGCNYIHREYCEISDICSEIGYCCQLPRFGGYLLLVVQLYGSLLRDYEMDFSSLQRHSLPTVTFITEVRTLSQPIVSHIELRKYHHKPIIQNITPTHNSLNLYSTPQTNYDENSPPHSLLLIQRYQ